MGLIGPESAHLSDHRAKFDAAAADGFLRGIRDGLTSPEAMAYAGANINQWQDITATGLVPAVTERTAKTLAAYSREDIDAFLAKVRYSTGRGDPSAMTDLTKAARVAQCTVLEIIHMVIDRKLDKVAESPSRKGLAGVLIDPKEVISLLPLKEKKGLTTAEASKRLGLNEDVVRALMAAGHIHAIPTGKFAHGREVCHIPEKEVEAFAARYASLWDVAQSMGSRSRWKTNERLAAAGIVPAFTRAEFGQDIYERAATEGR